jgi:hypothetical protein
VRDHRIAHLQAETHLDHTDPRVCSATTPWRWPHAPPEASLGQTRHLLADAPFAARADTQRAPSGVIRFPIQVFPAAQSLEQATLGDRARSSNQRR